MNLRKKAVLTACSDPLSEQRVQEARSLMERLREEGLEVDMPGTVLRVQ